MDVGKDWRVFLIQLAFAREYPMAYQVSSPGLATRNPILESILPSLLYIKMAALMDGALEEYIAANQLQPGKRYRADFNGRINFCSDSGFINNGADLHGVRTMRNDTAHKPLASVDWDELDRDIVHVHRALKQLGFVGERPEFRVEAERSAFRQSDEPGILGSRDYSVRVMHGDKKAAEFKWGETLHDDPAS